MSFTTRLPVSVVKTVGVNVTWIEQVAPAAKVCGAIGHLDVSVKSPDVAMLLIVSAVVCVLLSMTSLAALGVLMAMFPNERVVAFRV